MVRVRKGVRQGYVLSPSLFNILAEALTRRALDDYEKGFRIGGRVINNLRYADNIILVATTAEALQELVDGLVSKVTYPRLKSWHLQATLSPST
jgi:Reverse transcriptase (RNA-dependent DNA polymerase)